MFDRARLPLSHEYYETLPEGLRSHPDCTTVRDTFELLFREFTELDALVDEGVLERAFVREMKTSSELAWIPEVHFQCLATLYADLHGEQAYMDWSRESAKELYRRPILRHLMRLLSPTLVVMGAASRWQTVRKGSSLRAGRVEKAGGRTRTVTLLEHPSGVYAPVFHLGLGQAFAAAVEVSGGRETRCELLESGPAQTSYELSWER